MASLELHTVPETRTWVLHYNYMQQKILTYIYLNSMWFRRSFEKNNNNNLKKSHLIDRKYFSGRQQYFRHGWCSLLMYSHEEIFKMFTLHTVCVLSKVLLSKSCFIAVHLLAPTPSPVPKCSAKCWICDPLRRWSHARLWYFKPVQ